MPVEVDELARRIRVSALRMTSGGRSSHIGSVLGLADILAALYGSVLELDPGLPDMPNRDRVILSKGHAGAGIYAVLAELGFLRKETLSTHCIDGSLLSGHVSHKGIPGVELSTGSLGHGLSVACGMAHAAKIASRPHRVFCIMSDGECDEGSVWEAALFAAHNQLSNLVAVVDYNKLQSLGSVEATMRLEPFAAKWSAFGWRVSEADGHDLGQLESTLNINPQLSREPNVVLAHTTKGKGVSFMENSVLWHYRSPQGEEFERALTELETR